MVRGLQGELKYRDAPRVSIKLTYPANRSCACIPAHCSTSVCPALPRSATQRVAPLHTSPAAAGREWHHRHLTTRTVLPDRLDSAVPAFQQWRELPFGVWCVPYNCLAVVAYPLISNSNFKLDGLLCLSFPQQRTVPGASSGMPTILCAHAVQWARDRIRQLYVWRVTLFGTTGLSDRDITALGLLCRCPTWRLRTVSARSFTVSWAWNFRACHRQKCCFGCSPPAQGIPLTMWRNCSPWRKRTTCHTRKTCHGVVVSLPVCAAEPYVTISVCCSRSSCLVTQDDDRGAW